MLIKSIKSLTVFAVLSICSLIYPPAYAAGSTWHDMPYDHFSKDEPLSDLLADFSSTIGIPIIISNRLQTSNIQNINGHFKNVTAEMFLLKLSNLYQLVWYFDGHMLYVYHADEMKSELLSFGEAKSHAVQRTLKRLGVWDARFNWREMKERNLLFISGPPRYIELVKEVSTLIDTNLKKQKDTTYVVKVFNLKHAWAEDRKVTHRGNGMIIPGVATTIQKILARSSLANDRQNRNGKGLVGKDGLKGQGMVPGAQPELGDVTPGGTPAAGENAYVEANSQQNAVIVYDLKSRMSMYGKLIESLDIPAEQIEIEVSIIDISTTRLMEIGVDWQAGGSNGSFGFGDATNIDNLESTTGLSHTFGLDSGQSLTSVLSGNANFFLGKVRALAQDGEGQVLSQPSVMTMNNLEAIIDQSTTFYVKLEGDEEVDLVPISAGSVLRVTPRIVDTKIRDQIHLDVAIEDGRVSTEGDDVGRVDGIPSIINSTINTQAIVGNESSLLVGGYYYDSRSKSENKVPVLGDIPVIKRLFNNENKQRIKMARLFMITPRLIDPVADQERAAQVQRVLDQDRNFNDGYVDPNFEIMTYSKPENGIDIYD